MSQYNKEMPFVCQMYLAYVKNCKFTSPNTLHQISFMRRSLVEVLGKQLSIACCTDTVPPFSILFYSIIFCFVLLYSILHSDVESLMFEATFELKVRKLELGTTQRSLWIHFVGCSLLKPGGGWAIGQNKLWEWRRGIDKVGVYGGSDRVRFCFWILYVS